MLPTRFPHLSEHDAGYTFDHAGRNAGIMIGFWLFFLIVHAIGSEHQKDPLSTGGQTIFKRGKQPPAEAVQGDEAAVSEKPAIVARESYAKDKEHDDEELAETFAWENVFYDVPVGGGTRRLLNGVSGYVKPGTLTALMGESGAGQSLALGRGGSSLTQPVQARRRCSTCSPGGPTSASSQARSPSTEARFPPRSKPTRATSSSKTT